MSSEQFTVCITVAAKHVGRSVDTMRRYALMGSVAGVRLDVWRNPLTNIRYFRRSQVEALRDALSGCKRMSPA